MFSFPYQGIANFVGPDGKRFLMKSDPKQQMSVSEGPRGLFLDIHEFSQFFWAPESSRVALTDGIYDRKEVENWRTKRQQISCDCQPPCRSTALPINKSCNSPNRINWRSDNELDYLCGAESTYYVMNKSGILSESKNIE